LLLCPVVFAFWARAFGRDHPRYIRITSFLFFFYPTNDRSMSGIRALSPCAPETQFEFFIRIPAFDHCLMSLSLPQAPTSTAVLFSFHMPVSSRQIAHVFLAHPSTRGHHRRLLNYTGALLDRSLYLSIFLPAHFATLSHLPSYPASPPLSSLP